MNVSSAYFTGDLGPVRKFLEEQGIDFGHKNKRRVVVLRNHDIHIMGLREDWPDFAPVICRIHPDERGDKQANERVFKALKKEFAISKKAAEAAWKARTDERRRQHGFRLRKGHPPPSQERLKDLESELGIGFPKAYREFLLQHNGGTPDDDCFKSGEHGGSVVDFFLAVDGGKHDDLARYWRMYAGRIPRGYVPIARDPGGNLILIGCKGTSKGRIFFWDHEEEGDPDALSCVADSLDSFINGLRALSPVNKEFY